MIPKTKKADTEQHPAKVVFHVGLLINEPPGRAEMPFASSSAISFYEQSSCRTTASGRQFVFPLFLNSQSGSGGLSARKPFFAF